MLFVATFFYYAFGDMDNGIECYGQVVTPLGKSHSKYKQVTGFTVEGMNNIDVSGHIHLWYFCGFFLLIAQVLIQGMAICWHYTKLVWVETLYLIFDGVMLCLLAAWFSFGAYWRFSEFGELCSTDYTIKQGQGMLIFYEFNVFMAFLSCIWCCIGCCSGFWSYFASLPNTRY